MTDAPRKRKWDEPSAAAAASAAAISQRLAGAAAAAPEPPLLETVDMCSATSSARSLLTKRQTLDELSRLTGCNFGLRGVYVQPGSAAPPGEQALHLSVTLGAAHASKSADERRAALQAGVAAVRERLSPTQPQLPPPPPLFGGPPPPVSLPVDTGSLAGALEAVSFGLLDRIRGPEGAFLAHISRTSGATLVLRGRGSGLAENEPLALNVAAPSPDSLAAATRLARHLLDTIANEWRALRPHSGTTDAAEDFLSSLLPPPPSLPPPPPLPSAAHR